MKCKPLFTSIVKVGRRSVYGTDHRRLLSLPLAAAFTDASQRCGCRPFFFNSLARVIVYPPPLESGVSFSKPELFRCHVRYKSLGLSILVETHGPRGLNYLSII